MPRRALDNPIVLAVLGLLLEGCSHPYQMFSVLRERSDAHAAAITRGTLYNTVAALVEAGWVAEEGQQRSGNRPERTVYAITPAGSAELVRRLDEQIRTPELEFSRFLGAISYLGALGRDGATAALTERAERLRALVAAAEERHTAALATGVPRLFVIEAEYATAITRAEAVWVESVIDDIRDGTLTWPAPPAAGAPQAQPAGDRQA